jgi:hypothetical protein
VVVAAFIAVDFDPPAAADFMAAAEATAAATEAEVTEAEVTGATDRQPATNSIDKQLDRRQDRSRRPTG